MSKEENLYECSICKLKYKDKDLAERCEEWCKKHKSCNTEIMKYAVREKFK